MTRRLGLIVNPVAGLGGPVGLKGSDGAFVQDSARRLGGTPAAPHRALVALEVLGDADAVLLTASGAMGEAACRQLDLDHAVVVRFGAETQGPDTTAAASALAAAGASLILFAGGDGTARDVAAGAGSTPILGIPAGVKMYSGVFAASPALAGRLAGRFLETRPALRRTCEVEILDIDPDDPRDGESAIRLHATARVPASPAVQRAKASGPADDDGQVEALCRQLAAALEPGCRYIVGPGRTMRLFMRACGLPKTLLGVDVITDGVVLAKDCSESQILTLIEDRPARVVVGLLGGVGCLFGRGNQPISSRVLHRLGRDRILVLAGAAKVASLPHGLFLDTGDPALDAALAGFIRIETGPGRSTLLRLRAPDPGML